MKSNLNILNITFVKSEKVVELIQNTHELKHKRFIWCKHNKLRNVD